MSAPAASSPGAPLTEREAPDPGPPVRAMAVAFAVLRVFTGVVWLSNAAAKLTGVAVYDWGVVSFNLVTTDVARAIALSAADATALTPLGAFYRDVVVAHWDVFAPFLTVTEPAIGLGLVAGALTRAAAPGGLLLLTPIWVMLLHTGGYLWEYPAEDLLPLLLLATVPAGRTAGLDRLLAGRLGPRWPW